jgi:hypothetical protein
MGGFQPGVRELRSLQFGNPMSMVGPGTPGGGVGGGIGTKPGGTLPGGAGALLGGVGPGQFQQWAKQPGMQTYQPTSAETLLSQQHAPPPGGGPNPVPSWYQGDAMFRGADHPSPFIGRGVQQQQRQTLRGAFRPPQTTQAQNTSTTSQTAPQNNVSG